MTATIAPTERHSSIEELDRAIVNLSARINAASYELLVLIRQFDERAGWLGWSFTNCTEWLHWRCDLSLSAAREKVRVAHALKTLPAIALSFSRGELSYSKVRSLTRVARTDNEEALKAFALKTTAARVEERCRELRCGTADSVVEANRSHARRSLRMHRDPVRNIMTLTVEVPLEDGELIDKALDRARESSIASGPEFAAESWAAQQADALVTMAKRYLNGQSSVSSASSDNYLDRWYFRRPDGIAVPNCGYRPEDMLDDDIDAIVYTSVNNPSAEGLLTRSDKTTDAEELPTLPLIVAERDPPAYLM